jgi:hypothetical protein
MSLWFLLIDRSSSCFFLGYLTISHL